MSGVTPFEGPVLRSVAGLRRLGAAVTDARPQLTDKEAENFTIQRVLGWMPPTVYSPR